jgi:peptidoglycan/xylan/chitin deacetylase (PgdA/CDA1 family)
MHGRKLRSAAVVALCLLGAQGGHGTDNPVVEPRMTIPPGGNAAPRVALTFDACSGAADRRILVALVQNEIPATFFVTARWIARNPGSLDVLLRHGDLFEIENHGYRHVPAIDRAMWVYGLAAAGSSAAVRAEVEGGARAVAEATGRSPKWFRGATARYTQSSLALIRSMNISVAGYSIASDSGALLGARTTALRIGAAHDGDVILAHVNHPERPAGSGVVAGILALKGRGYRFVRLDRSDQ